MEQDELRTVFARFITNKGELCDYDLIRDRIMIRLNNPARNEVEEKDLVYRYFQDLVITYHLVVEHNEERMVSIPVKKSILDNWHITEEELYEDGIKNIDNLNDPSITSMSEMLLNLGVDISREEIDGPSLYVVTNNCNNYGAVVVMSQNLLDTAGKLIGDNFWIIPSSIHEMILAPASVGQTRDELEEMVRNINQTQVAPEEVLGNKVYYYDRTSRSIS